jgi:thiosulfate dehydrogenase
MRKVKQILLGTIGGLLMMAALVGCATTTTEPPPDAEPAEPTTAPDEAPSEPELAGDIVRGGAMYDKWWVVIEADSPTGDHPLWATQSTNERSGTDSWRCKECHGWDYKGADGAYGSGSHYTGFPGVFSLSGTSASEILEMMKGSTNPDHDFSGVMSEQDMIDMSLFISQGLIDTADYVGAEKAAIGDAAAGEGDFDEVCSLCHGPEGVAINFHGVDDPEFVRTIAVDNPWEFLHKVRFGQPGWPMPSAITNEWSDAQVADVLAYSQTLPEDATLTFGGQLYDKWWEVLELDEPTDDQPLWATQSTNERSGKDTWRCKECHGWDYMGADGAYGSGSHFTGFPGVMSAADLSEAEIAAWLSGETNPDHDFSMLGEFGIGALTAFLRGELDDVSPFINDDKSVTGDPALGEGMFDGTCASCHGTDGKKINFHDADDPEYVGTVASGNPWEFIHKVTFGQPGEPMPSGSAMGWSLEDIVDLLAYVQTLPTE